MVQLALSVEAEPGGRNCLPGSGSGDRAEQLKPWTTEVTEEHRGRSSSVRLCAPLLVGVLFYGCGFFGEHLADAADLGSDAFQLFFNVFIAAVDVVDAIDDGFSV